MYKNVMQCFENATDAMYKNAVQCLVIERSLLFLSSKCLRLEVLYVLQKFEYKLSRKDYL